VKTALGVTVARMCGGPTRRGRFARRIPGGFVLDWFGVGVWRTRGRS
jgi:hypothetical protein